MNAADTAPVFMRAAYRSGDQEPVASGSSHARPATAERAPRPDLNALAHSIAGHRDRAAFACLYNWFAPRLTALGLQLGLGLDSSLELAQETMLNVWRRAQTFDPCRSTLSTWVYTIMRDTRVELMGRRNQVLGPDDAADLLMDDNIVGAFSQRPNIEVLIQQMAALTTDQRRVAAKQFFENKSHSVIAGELNFPLRTIQSWSKQALAQLQPVFVEVVTQ